MTAIRQAIMKLFTEHGLPLSAMEAMLKLKQKGIKVNKTTIYRQLKSLEKSGVLDYVQIELGIEKYDLAKQEHHHHMVCRDCKQVLEVSTTAAEDALTRLEQTLAETTKFGKIEHSLEFFGICQSCSN